jgi:hypothetical protein
MPPEERTRFAVPVEAIRKLADAGKRAGFSFEDMVALLDSGITVEKLAELIESGLIKTEPPKNLM